MALSLRCPKVHFGLTRRKRSQVTSTMVWCVRDVSGERVREFRRIRLSRCTHLHAQHTTAAECVRPVMPVSSGILSLVASLPFPQHQSKIRTCFGFSGLAVHPVPTISFFPVSPTRHRPALTCAVPLLCMLARSPEKALQSSRSSSLQVVEDEFAPAPAQRHPPECCSRHHRPTPRSLVFGRTENLLAAIRHTRRQPHWTLASGLWRLTPPLGPYTDVKERIGKCRRLQDF